MSFLESYCRCSAIFTSGALKWLFSEKRRALISLLLCARADRQSPHGDQKKSCTEKSTSAAYAEHPISTSRFTTLMVIQATKNPSTGIPLNLASLPPAADCLPVHFTPTLSNSSCGPARLWRAVTLRNHQSNAPVFKRVQKACLTGNVGTSEVITRAYRGHLPA